MDVTRLPLYLIEVGERRRAVDADKVTDLAKSIETQGLFQAIGVRPSDVKKERYDVIFGAHRLEAYKLLRRTHIDAYVLPADLTPEEYVLIELQENSVRHDLSGAQRKAYAAEIGKLLQKLRHNPNSQNLDMSWWEQIWKSSGITEQTLRNWWNAFCREAELSLTPRQALDVHKQHFYTWLEEQRKNEEVEQARRREEIRQEKQVRDFLDTQDALHELCKDYGEEAVFYGVVCAVFPDLAPAGLPGTRSSAGA